MRWLPDRDFCPFWPRPDVLPLPEPCPRPTRLRSRWLPSAGCSVCRFSSLIVLHLHQRGHLAQHPLQRRRVLVHRALVDAPQAQCPHGATMLRAGAYRASHLRDPQLRHQDAASAAAAAVSAACAASATTSECGLITSRTSSPRSLATSSGRFRFLRPSTVAISRLIGLAVPSDLARMSRTPPSSSTARTPAPAITPVPSLAGFSITWPAP